MGLHFRGSVEIFIACAVIIIMVYFMDSKQPQKFEPLDINYSYGIKLTETITKHIYL